MSDEQNLEQKKEDLEQETDNKTEAKSEDLVFDVNYKELDRAHFNQASQRLAAWEDSLKNSDRFWGNFAKKNIDWFAPFDTVQSGSFEKGDIAWFLSGKLNVSYNCIDRWVKYKPDAIAIIWEGNEANQSQYISFKELQEEVCKMSNVLKRYGVQRGDIVVIYMPMIVQAAYAMLACSRIGAPHSVIFAGFSRDAIRDRILDANAKYVITSNIGFRGTKIINLKEMMDDGIIDCKCIKKVFVWIRDKDIKNNMKDIKCNMVHNRDLYLNQEMNKERPYMPCEVMDSEDTLFLLYTSGSTGKPKGLLHTTAGYLVYSMATHRYVFDIQPGDIYACVADIGWITGHSYIIYGPLANGCTTFMFESIPTYPNPGRYWDMIERHKITQFYTSPTAIRALMKYGSDYVKKYNLQSLKVLGSVGEPINPESWLWYYKIIGNSKVPIVDTYWQTESGGILITPFPGCSLLKPGSATLPFFGIEPALLDKESLKEIPNDSKNDSKDGILVIKRPWPGIARTVYSDHERYLNTYMNVYNGYYYTGDGAKRDLDGYYWITGRIDDVLNVSGHRLGTAEIESVVVQQKGIIESAVVGIPHDIKGQCIFVYAIAEDGIQINDNLSIAIKNLIRNKLGAFYTPDYILSVKAVPKTRSGKIMRRILRKIAEEQYENLGDITTLADSDVIQELIQKRKELALKMKQNK